MVERHLLVGHLTAQGTLIACHERLELQLDVPCLDERRVHLAHGLFLGTRVEHYPHALKLAPSIGERHRCELGPLELGRLRSGLRLGKLLRLLGLLLHRGWLRPHDEPLDVPPEALHPALAMVPAVAARSLVRRLRRLDQLLCAVHGDLAEGVAGDAGIAQPLRKAALLELVGRLNAVLLLAGALDVHNAACARRHERHHRGGAVPAVIPEGVDHQAARQRGRRPCELSGVSRSHLRLDHVRCGPFKLLL